MVVIRISILLVLVIVSIGCERKGGEEYVPETPRSGTNAREDALIARVSGTPIRANDVEYLIEEADGGLSPEAAVDVLVRHHLLAKEARRRGFSDWPEVVSAAKAEQVKTLLRRQIRERITTDTIPEERLRAYYERKKKSYVHGVERRVVHFVALTGKRGLADSAAKALAEKAYTEAQGAASDVAFRDAVKKLVVNRPSHGKVETLPSFERTSDRFVAPFVNAAFEISEVGGISRPFKTKFGWHVIYLIEETPALTRRFEEVREELSEILLPNIRKEEAGRLMGRLLKENPPFIYEEALDFGSVAP